MLAAGAPTVAGSGTGAAVALEGESGTVVAPNFSPTTGPEAPDDVVPELWWRWTAPSTGPYRFHTHGSELDTVLTVFTGKVGARGGTDGLTQLRTDDDAGSVVTSEVTFPAKAGEAYLIRVAAKRGDAGLVTLGWTAQAPTPSGPQPRTAGPSATSAEPSDPASTILGPSALAGPTAAALGVEGGFPISVNTGEKPQSKIWRHDGTWWAVLASTDISPAGTWLWRHDAGGWTNVLRLTSDATLRADTRRVGDVTHILLHGPSPVLVSVEYDAAAKTYKPWSKRPTATPVALSGSETATIDIDSTGRMWLASDSQTSVEVRYADAPYTSFSSRVVLASDITEDDIAVVTAMPGGRVGVLWSNQATRRFGFRTHADGTAPSTWTSDEVPAGQSARNLGGGMADDHLNVAVASDGTLYAAVKTSYETPGEPVIGLLVRRPNGTWDGLREIDDIGTRGIVQLDESTGTLRVIYTQSTNFDNILMKSASTKDLAFPASATTVMAGNFNNVTSTKENASGSLMIMASSVTKAWSTVLGSDPGPAPEPDPQPDPAPAPGEVRGQWLLDEGSGTVVADSSGLGNDGTVQGTVAWGPGRSGSSLVLDGSGGYVQVPDADSLDVSAAMTVAAWVRPQVLATQYVVKKAVVGSRDGFELSMSSTGRAFFRVNEVTSGDRFRVSASSAHALGSWVHLAGTYDGTTMRFYVDGVLQGSVAGPAAVATNALGLGIGAEPGGNRKFRGGIDEVRLYDRALSPQEITALMSAPAPDPQPAAPVVVDGSVSTTAGTAVDGTLKVGSSSGGPLQFEIVTPPHLGTVTLTDAARGTFRYVPAAGAVGQDSFTFRVRDGQLWSEPGTMTVTITAPAPAPSGVRGQWLLDEGSGTVVADSSGLGNDGTVQGTVAWGPGRSGSSLVLDGSGGYVQVPDADSLDVSAAMTVAAWVRPQVLATQYVVKKAVVGSRDGFELSMSSTGRAFFRVNEVTSGDRFRVSASSAHALGSWVHLAGTYDGTTMRFYVDGVLQGSVAGPAAVATNALGLGIGAEPGGNRKFRGGIDEVRLYDRALSAQEIAGLAGR
ncbi:concanavalin A-like lectin/glucanase superfamily protein [Georgenia soli]|uniref:Concanavalin A-like lectin/glucanase superfamily protein n=1 Tax=Georgenia soli TaxID=638953 RepID=A0A2A9EID2_9MICO|nr:concanavalin A-like lectin/glucanase superfamily protein [Georgenia soli]